MKIIPGKYRPTAATRASSRPVHHGCGRPAPEPRTGQQFEPGLKAELFDKKVNAHAARFRMEDENRVMPDPAPLFSIGAGKMRSQGVKAELSGSPLPGWSVTGGYACSSTRTLEGSDDQKAQLYTFIAPRHNFNVGTTYPPAGAMHGHRKGGGRSRLQHRTLACLATPHYNKNSSHSHLDPDQVRTTPLPPAPIDDVPPGRHDRHAAG
ncbi:TonB-dependent receptor domain-containing protein [Janthinobacterium sp. FT14W]|uniref:TonB-dependent receptor domain-containing protein n=1 Tax=Janthinobacterium sp. FT14W TaxID=2654253 RepID=UPI001D002A54|nr:TonB-dependent receptor [Janthinobacterium sp. FT14W]